MTPSYPRYKIRWNTLRHHWEVVQLSSFRVVQSFDTLLQAERWVCEDAA